MKHLFVYLFSLLPLAFYAQTTEHVKGVTFETQDSLIIVSYTLEGRGLFEVKAYYASNENGPFREIPQSTTKGDIGKRIRKGKDKSFSWELLKAGPGFVGLMTIKVVAEPYTDQGEIPPYNISLSLQSFAPIDNGIPNSLPANTLGGRLGWGNKWGGRLSYISSSDLNEGLATLAIAKSISRSSSSNWNIYLVGGPVIPLASGQQDINEWYIGGGTDITLGPLYLNLDILSNTTGGLRAVGGIGWAFKVR